MILEELLLSEMQGFLGEILPGVYLLFTIGSIILISAFICKQFKLSIFASSILLVAVYMFYSVQPLQSAYSKLKVRFQQGQSYLSLCGPSEVEDFNMKGAKLIRLIIANTEFTVYESRNNMKLLVPSDLEISTTIKTLLETEKIIAYKISKDVTSLNSKESNTLNKISQDYYLPIKIGDNQIYTEQEYLKYKDLLFN